MKYAKYWLIALLLLMFSGIALAEADDDEDVPKYYGKELCSYPDFTCVEVKQGDTWEKMFPDPREREIVKRLNRTNMALSYRAWIVVPKDLKRIDNLDLSPFPDKVEATGNRVVVVNLTLHAFGAYDDEGNLVHWGPISSGKDWCSDVGRPCKTPVGSYKVINKNGAKCISKVFPIETNGGAPMPYCMHFFRGYALHASKELPGFHASHGCVRLFLEDAIWLNKEFTNIGTSVIVMK